MRPPPVRDRAQRFRTAAAVLVVDVVAAEVVTALDAAGIPSLLLKGPAVAAWLYGPSEVRPYVDIDLLVPVDRRADAEGVLDRLGFRYLFEGVRPVEEKLHARTWVRGDEPTVDLHTTLNVLPTEAPHAFAVLGADARTLVVSGVVVAVPRPACMALIVALHALQRGPGEQQLLDELARAIRIGGIDLWKEAAGVASELRAGGLLRAALGLVPTGAALADEIGLPPVPVRAAILATASADARACALAFDRIGTSSSWRHKGSLLMRLVIPTPSYLRATRAGGDAGLVAGYRRRWTRLKSARDGYLIWRSAIRDCGASRRIADRVEIVAWSLGTRVLVGAVGTVRTLGLLDRVRLQRSTGERLAQTDHDALFRLAGRCLGQSIARSQYLRVRGRPHWLILGVDTSTGDFQAHAWLEPLDPAPAEFEVLHRFSR